MKSPVVIATEVAEELLARLAWMTIKPEVVLTVGCEEDVDAQLQQLYSEAKIVASSLPPNDDPLPDQSVDVIFANMVLPWQADNKKVFQTWRRLLRPNGLLIFSTLGLDTLKECQTLFGKEMLPHLVDMHDMGDGLLTVGFSDPVLDVDYYTTVYRNKEKLIHELYTSGMLQVEPSAAQVEQLIATEDNTYELTYEVIYAHAFAPLQKERNVVTDGVVKVPLSQLRRSL